MVWICFESQALRDAAVSKMSRADIKHSDRKVFFNPDQPIDVRARHSVLRGVRKFLLFWNFQKSTLWIDEDNMTIHYKMGLIAKVRIMDGKISINYGREWEDYLK